jgi:HSP20 family molecular chaperone IbpA
MSTMIRRRSNPVSEMLNWLEADPPLPVRGLGLAPYIRVEDFVEDGTYVLRAEMPGIDPEQDLDLSIDGDVLTIRGERTEEEKTKNRHEFHYGSFARSLTLPQGAKADELAASYTDGVLEIRVPMDGESVQPRKIRVQRTVS